ncbi:MAG: LysM peptidoglycan-binding domain-containing protein [Muribaculaceae bacterium]|nr:LysM peptidoglycan-binding domain-containing protein [Muribaculaceae bacterium]
MKILEILPLKVGSIKFLAIVILALSAGFSMRGENADRLPKTEMLGKQYYLYEVKKGESIYGIAKRYGWDLEELLRLNPEASGHLNRGMKLYYPTGQVSVVTEMPQPVEIDPSSLEPIRHKVKKGETVYSISRQYNVPLDVIYKYNPSAKKGVKTGEIIEIPQTGRAQYYYYTVKRGDTMASVANTYNTSVEDILRNNPGLTVDNFREGESIRISINSNVANIKTELVKEDRVASIGSYKVAKNETWEEISEKTGVDVEVLKEANDAAQSEGSEPKEHSVVSVPIVETVEIEKTISYESPEEMSEEEVIEIYDSVKGNFPESEEEEGVRLAVILDEPNSKKDIDFSRGVLVALSEMKSSPYKINLKILDGRVASSNLIEELDNFEPNLIVSTADKAFPIFLADYGNTNNIQIVNVFDLKNDLYEDNASMIQILQPSSLFNDRIASRLYKDNSRRRLIMVGEQDENDGIGSELMNLFSGNVEVMSLEDFGSYEPELSKTGLIYSYATKKEEVADFLKNVESLAENNPGYGFNVVGRLSWIAMQDDFSDMFAQYSVSIPSRVWLDEDSRAWRNFSAEYEKLFDGSPVRSVPNFAASGYDIATYFIPLVAENHGDFNKGYMGISEKAIQNDISLKRVNNWGGFINEVGYVVMFSEDGKMERVVVK